LSPEFAIQPSVPSNRWPETPPQQTIATHQGIVPRRDLRVGRVQLAEAAGAGQLDAEHAIGHTQALRAALIHPPVSPGRGDDHLAFRDGQAGGLFAVHVLALPHRQGGRQRVPAVAGGNQHGIQIRALGQKRANVRRLGTAVVPVLRVDQVLDHFPPALVQVADRQELHIRLGQHFAQHRPPPASQPDACDSED
jgi:hypothetical protein